MTITELIKDLQAIKKDHGNTKINFSSDEEGNQIYSDCFFGGNEDKTIITIYPNGQPLDI